MKRLIIYLIKMYQIIPFNSHTACRFEPTCSNYMIGCLEEHGLIKGLKLGFKRILRCRPKGPFGYDPVPKKGN